MASRKLVRAVSSLLSLMFVVRQVADVKGERVCSLGALPKPSADSSCGLFLSPYKVPFEEAIKDCRERGTRLAVMNLGDVEQDIVGSLTGKAFWIDENSSLADDMETGNFRRPHGNGVKKCKILLLDDGDMPDIKLTPCSKKSFYLCQTVRPDISKDINEDSTSLGLPGYTVNNRDKVLGTEGTPNLETKSSKGLDNLLMYVLVAIGCAILVVLIVVLALVVRNTLQKRQAAHPPHYYDVHPSTMSEEERDRISTLSSLRRKPHIRLRGETPAGNTEQNKVSSGDDYHEYCEIDLCPVQEEDRCGSTEKIIAVEGDSGVQMVDNVVYSEQYSETSIDKENGGHYDLERVMQGQNLTVVEEKTDGKGPE